MKLVNEHVFVTGGANGIGAAIVTHLAYLGYTVYGTYNSNPEQAQLLATHLTNEGAKVHFIQMNVVELLPLLRKDNKLEMNNPLYNASTNS